MYSVSFNYRWRELLVALINNSIPMMLVGLNSSQSALTENQINSMLCDWYDNP